MQASLSSVSVSLAVLLVGLGGALGSIVRYLVGRGVTAWLGSGFPWGTLLVNLLGGFLMGALVAALSRRGVPSEPVRLLLAVGVLGGFTTFSAFSLEAMGLLQRGALLALSAYVLASVIGSIAALGLGLWLVRSVSA
jgi:fluoride exporter